MQNPILIAHRGNTNGMNPDSENSPDYLMNALNNGYWVETDVWKLDDSDIVGLGHDRPEYNVNISFLTANPKIICHAKTIDTLHYLLQHNLHCFFHDVDECVLTSQNFIWTYPGKELTERSISVMPEWEDPNFENILPNNCFGICSDRIEELEKIFMDKSSQL